MGIKIENEKITCAVDPIARKSSVVTGTREGSRSVGAGGIHVAVVASIFPSTLVVIGAGDTITIIPRVAGTRVGSRSVGAGGIRIAVITSILPSTLVVIGAGDTITIIPRVASASV